MRSYLLVLALAALCAGAAPSPTPADEVTPAQAITEAETLRIKVQELQSQVDSLKAQLAEAEKTIATLNAKLAAADPKSKAPASPAWSASRQSSKWRARTGVALRRHRAPSPVIVPVIVLHHQSR